MQKKDTQKKKLKIALLGTRGIPARYGGFETFAEELSSRLVERGHEVTVYCRRFFGEAKPIETSYKGVTQVFLPTVRHKYLETILHSLFSFLDLFRRRYDVALLCNAANSPFSFLVRLRGLPLFINVDGIERRRSKWNALGRLWYRIGEITSTWFATRIVADAKVIADYYLQTYRCQSSVIAYGGTAIKKDSGLVLSSLGIHPEKYILYVSRLEPENNALGVIKAYGLSECNLPLVVVGDAPYATSYKESLKLEASKIMSTNGENNTEKNTAKKVIFAGFKFGADYHELQSHCYLYIQATEVGGTHPALVEAMAYGNCVIANGTPENVEVLGDAGVFYSVNDFAELAKRLSYLVGHTEERGRLQKLAKARADKEYSWERICDQYLELFYNF